MNIYIAYDYEATPLGMLLAIDQRSAELVWTGMGIAAHRVEEIDPSNNDQGIHGVVTLMTSVLLTKYDVDRKSRDWSTRIWKRGS